MGVHAGVDLTDLELTGERLTLRRWHEADAERVHEVVDGGGMREFLNLPDPYTLETAREFVTGIGDEGRADGTGVGSAMVEARTGRVVGACALRLTGDDPDIGYWVAPDARGHGYAAEATGLLSDFAFSLGLPRVGLRCAAANVASVRTALAAGFRFEGVARNAVTSPGLGPDGPPRRGLLARFARLADDPDGPVAPAFPPLPPGGLTDGTVAIRTLRPDDVAALAETEDEESVRWGFTGRARSSADLALWAERAGLDWLVGTSAQSAIVDVATGRVAGQINLRLSGPPGVGGLGYAVHPFFRGRGYTSRALRLVSDWAFAQAGLGRLELGAKMGNVASQRAAANAGFASEPPRRGRLRNADGTFDDEARFYLLRPA